MLCAIDFVTRAVFEALEPAPDMAAISINDPDEQLPANLPKFVRSLSLFFLDVEPEGCDAFGTGAFTAEMADSAAEFIRQLHMADRPFRLVIHCRMGASRSAAVALLAHTATGGDFPRYAHAYDANRHVLALEARAVGVQIEVPPRPAQGDDWIPLPSAVLI